jgi:hypothetical protein
VSDFDIDALLFGTKICPCCGEVLPANTEKFGKDATKPDGLTIWCRECRNQRQQERYRRDPSIRERKVAAQRLKRAVSP